MNIKKSLLSLLLALCLVAGLMPPALAAAPVVPDFVDVAPTAWYGENGQDIVGDSYRFGLMRGVSETRFAPEQTLTVAQGVTMAVRALLMARELEDIITTGPAWYEPYFDLAAQLDLLPEDITVSQAALAITRAQSAALFAAVAEELQLPVLREVLNLPDVSGQTPHYQDIILLYDTGVLSGSDGAGTFFPYRSLTRAEGAAIALRLLDETRRRPVTLDPSRGQPLSRHYTAGMRIASLAQLYDLCYISSEQLNSNLSVTISYGLYNSLTREEFPFDRGIDGWSAQYNRMNQRLTLHLTLDLYQEVSSLLKGLAQPAQASAEARAWSASIAELSERTVAGTATQAQAAGALHDFVVSTYRYDTRVYTSALPDTAYSFVGLLRDGTGVCQGYAQLYQLLLDAQGIECCMVVGTANGGGHAWNMALLDGQRYQVDTTFDDPLPDRSGRVIRTYFAISDGTMARDHLWEPARWPDCRSNLA